jgi:hypothetical protein
MRNNPKFTICLVIGALLLLGAAPASAASPSWFSANATTTSVTPNAADVVDFLIPNASNTTCVVEYGKTTDYGFRTNCANAPFSGTSIVMARAHLTGVNGLDALTTYHFRMVATNADGTAATRDGTFTTPAGPPLIVSPTVLFLTDSSASVGSLVKWNGSPLTACFVEYGLTADYGNQVNCDQQPIDQTEISATANLANLNRATTYHFRMVAQNDLGVTRSLDRTFTTCAVTESPASGSC